MDGSVGVERYDPLSKIEGGTPEATVPQVTQELAFLNDSNERLHKSIAMLLERLEPILREPSANTMDGDQPGFARVPLAERIRQQAHMVEAAHLRIADIVDRLEV